MRGRTRQSAAALALILCALSFGCTGGEETAAQTPAPATPKAPPPSVNPIERLQKISPAIPIYAGADYRSDLTRRDATLAVNQFGANTVVYTLTTDDSFPQVWHYYAIYLAQFRAFNPLPPYPPANQVSRSMEIRLSEAMKDPFIPGDPIAAPDKQVVLQVAENEMGTGSLIRYIISPLPVTPVVAVSYPNSAAAQPAAPALR